jgi:hypothetical protein
MRGAIEAAATPDDLQVRALARRTGLSGSLVRACLALEFQDRQDDDRQLGVRLRAARTARGR